MKVRLSRAGAIEGTAFGLDTTPLAWALVQARPIGNPYGGSSRRISKGSHACEPQRNASANLDWSILVVYIKEEPVTATAKLFKNGRSQAVRLPREFRFEGDRVSVRRSGRGLLVEPVFTDVSAWFAELDRLASEPLMPEGRQQPPTPKRDVFE